MDQFRVDQMVTCLGEGNRVYLIHHLTEKTAYLITTEPGGVDGGWKSLHQLTPIVPVPEADGDIDMSIVRQFATCTVQPGEYHANDFIVAYAREIIRLRTEIDLMIEQDAGAVFPGDPDWDSEWLEKGEPEYHE